MTCEELQDVFELYSLALLEGEEKSEVEAHLARGCETCQKRLKDALAVNAVILASAPQTVPAARLRRRDEIAGRSSLGFSCVATAVELAEVSGAVADDVMAAADVRG